MSAFKVAGRLARHARTSTSTDGSVWLFVELAGHCNSHGVTAAQNYGRGNSNHYIADKAARQLRQGARVIVHSDGYTICDSPHRHLVLTNVDMIEQLDRVDYTEPQHGEQAA